MATTGLDRLWLLERLAELDDCDGYVVLVADPETGDSETYGPFAGLAAVLDAQRRRQDFDAEGLDDVLVTITRLHHH